MRCACRVLLAAAVVSVAGTAGEPEPVPTPTVVRASSQASPAGGKYAVESAFDHSAGTHWASANRALPQTIMAEWAEPVTADTVVLAIFAGAQADLYAAWKRCELRLDNGFVQSHTFEKPTDTAILRLPAPQTFRRSELHVLEVFEPRTYIGLNELTFYLDPGHLIAPPRELAKALPRAAMTPSGRPEHPCVYLTPGHLVLGRSNAEKTAWGAAERQRIVAEAAAWLEHDDGYWLAFLPEPGACYAYGFTGCPICGASFGTWGGARCAWDKPRQVACAGGHVLPDAGHPDDGTGYQAQDGRFHYVLGIWNAWVTEQWTLKAIPALSYAYALTGDERYAERAAFFLDALASIYAESTSGSWDYPSRPPSGRFARPWYQVARNLVVFVEAYDLLYASAGLDRPSLRPAIMARVANATATAQNRGVGTPDAKGRTEPGQTRRQNIDENLMIDGGQYCYEQTFHAGLANGHADYMRGALAVGALLGIEPYVDNAVDSPCSIRVMLANNADRDGRYFETALGYALHARNLYLTFVEPLLHWRSAKYPDGINLFEDARMRSFYALPSLSMDCAGHAPNFGDAGPDNTVRFPTDPPVSSLDAEYAEWLYAYAPPAYRENAARLLAFLSQDGVDSLRASSPNRRWLLFRATELPQAAAAGLPPDLTQRLSASWVMGQKGVAILRDGRGSDAQAALLRYGPSLNHGDKDDLGLIYYAKGWQMTYEIGYGLGSTHCQVGWGSQTASHCLVTVDESSQGGASGGSLTLFADLPALRLVEAESPLSYSNRAVSQYRRTVALIGNGADQVLVDLFRVRGGTRHDYGLGVQTQNVTMQGIELGPTESGSLAGKDMAWGQLIGQDGDVKGYPNKPYWNPPPGNGYGFFYDLRRAPATSTFLAEFAFGDNNQTKLRVHALPEAPCETVLAKAPGLYPHNRNAAYLLLRRQNAEDGTPLASTFAAVFEPIALPPDPDVVPAARLRALVTEAVPSQRYLADHDVVFLPGEKPGDAVTFDIPVPTAGTYRVVAGILRSPGYGTVRLLVDGQAVGEPFTATAGSISGPDPVAFGTCALAAGPHRVRLEVCAGTRYAVGIRWLQVRAADAPPPAPAAAPSALDRVERIAVSGAAGHMAPVGVHFRRNGRDEYLFSASPEEDVEHTASLPAGDVSWRGAIVYAALRDGRLETLATHGAWDVTVAGRPFGPQQGRYTGTVVAIDESQHCIDVAAAIPNDGISRLVVFRNPAYSRDTAYRIAGLTPIPGGGTRIGIGDQPVLLGCGRVHQVRPGNIIASDVPHDYARGVVGGATTRFFDGKRLTNGRGAETTIRQVVYEEPMRVDVHSAAGFTVGDTLLYYDVSPGDLAIVTTAWEGGPPAPPP